MNQKKQTEEKLRTAVAGYCDFLADSLPDSVLHMFSRDFENRMAQLCHRYIRREQSRQRRRRTCIAVIAIVLCTVIAVTLHPQVRAAVNGWIREILADKTVYLFPESKELRVTGFTVEWIPEGYEQVYEESEKSRYTVIFRQGEDVKTDIIISAHSITPRTEVTMHTMEGPHDIQSRTIQGCQGDLYVSLDGTGANSLIWIQDGILYTVTGYLEPEQIIKIAENLKIS